LVIAFLLIAVAASFIVPHPKQYQNPRPNPVYKINLDVEYHDKWREIMNDFKPDFGKFIQYFLKLTQLPQQAIDAAGVYGQSVYKNLYPEQIAEIEAIADLSGQDFGLVFALNLLYELTAFQSCSSILLRTAEG
jgi:hypothetical protein